MAAYNSFDQLMRDTKSTPEKRTDFIRTWLSKTYDIDYDLNPAHFEEVARVHNHDNQPLHFGRVPFESDHGTVYTELMKNRQNQWRLSVATDPNFSDVEVLDPKTSKASVQDYVTLLEHPHMPEIRTQPTHPYGYLEGISPYAVMNAQDAEQLPSVNPAAIPSYLLAAEVEGVQA